MPGIIEPGIWITALYVVADSDPVICHFVGAHGGTKTSKGRDRKIMFLWWAGLPKVVNWPFLGFHKLKNRLFDPYFGNFMAKMGENVYFHV